MHIRIIYGLILLLMVSRVDAHDWKGMDTLIHKAADGVDSLFDKQTKKLQKKYASLSKGMNKTNKATLNKLQRIREKILKKGNNADSTLFQLYDQQVLSKLTKDGAGLSSLNHYLPQLDSLATGLQFLNKTNGVLSSQLQEVQRQWNHTTAIQQTIAQHAKEWQQQLSHLGLVHELQKINKTVFYHQQQLMEYRKQLQDPDKIMQQVLGLLRNNPSFQSFMAANSQLAQLFQLPGSGSAQALAGLQTRAAMQQSLTSQIQSGGVANPSQYLEQQFQAASAELNKLKEKVNQAGGSGGNDLSMPGFKPNQQKTKTFWKRIEWGMNIQSQRPNGLLPVTTDVALTAGYKLSDQFTTGIGLAYKIGWGKNISHLKISHEGVGMRTYVDIKLKGSIWVSGGYEWNHQQAFNSIEALKDITAWQRSGLIGLSKKYSIGKKKGNVQLLWDFLSASQVPQTRAVKFRIGYVF